MKLFGSSAFMALEKGLDGSELRQKAISQNIANVDTPNYKAKNVSFEKIFKEELNKSNLNAYRTDKRHFQFVGNFEVYPVSEVRNTMYNHNNNNVDIDLEMAEQAKNQIYYNALVERLNGQFRSLQTVIRGGK